MQQFEALPGPRQFEPSELEYLKQIGNVTIMIHGFNVPEGHYPKAIKNIHKNMLPFEAAMKGQIPNDLEMEWSSLKAHCFKHHRW